MKNIAIFASGSGSNAENIICHFAQKPEFCVKRIYCNVPDAFVLERAKKYDIPTTVFDRQAFRDPEKILHQLEEEQTDFIVLAGFLWLIPDFIIAAYPNRIVNIHPALLPSYGGKGKECTGTMYTKLSLQPKSKRVVSPFILSTNTMTLVLSYFKQNVR